MNAIAYYEDLIRYLNQLLQNLSELTMSKSEEMNLVECIQGIIDLAKNQIVELEKDEGG